MSRQVFQSPALMRLGLGVGWILLPVGLLGWLSATPPALLRQQLMASQFWSLELCFWLLMATGALAAREWRARLARADIRALAGPVLLAVVLVLFVAPRTNRIFYDEQIYQGIGHNLSDLRRAQMCLDGSVEYGRLECAAGEYNKQPYAFPHLLSVVYRVVGPGPSAAFAVNAAVMAVLVAAVFLLTLRLFEDRSAAFFAALVMATVPQQLIWSATAAVEPLASLACVVALLGAVHFARARTAAALWFAGISAAYAVQVRPESVLILPVIALVLWRLAREELTSRRTWWVALGCFALVAVHLAHLYAVRNEGWGTNDARFAFRYVLPNLRVNGPFYAGDERFPVAYTALALAGLFGTGVAALRASVLLYFLSFLGVTLVFYAGSYNYGADVRYSLLTYPPIAVLAGLGAARLARWLHDTAAVRRATRVVGAVLLIQFLWYLPLVRATTQEAWAARADVRFAEDVARTLPKDAYVLTHNPGMFHLWGVNAGQMSLAITQPGRLQYLGNRYAGGVYLHWNFWCNVTDPVQQRFCTEARALAPAELFAERQERDQRFAFYRLEVSGGPWTRE